MKVISVVIALVFALLLLWLVFAKPVYAVILFLVLLVFPVIFGKKNRWKAMRKALKELVTGW